MWMIEWLNVVMHACCITRDATANNFGGMPYLFGPVESNRNVGFARKCQVGYATQRT